MIKLILLSLIFLSACGKGSSNSVSHEIDSRENSCRQEFYGLGCNESEDGLTCKNSCGEVVSKIYCATPKDGYAPYKIIQPTHVWGSQGRFVVLDASNFDDCNFFMVNGKYYSSEFYFDRY